MESVFRFYIRTILRATSVSLAIIVINDHTVMKNMLQLYIPFFRENVKRIVDVIPRNVIEECKKSKDVVFKNIIQRNLPILHNILLQILIIESFKGFGGSTYFGSGTYQSRLLKDIKMNTYKMYEYIFKEPLINLNFIKLYKEMPKTASAYIPWKQIVNEEDEEVDDCFKSICECCKRSFTHKTQIPLYYSDLLKKEKDAGKIAFYEFKISKGQDKFHFMHVYCNLCKKNYCTFY